MMKMRQVKHLSTPKAKPIALHKLYPTVLASLLSIGICSMECSPVLADISGLTPCAESKPFEKRKKQELKELQKRIKKVRVRIGTCTCTQNNHGRYRETI